MCRFQSEKTTRAIQKPPVNDRATITSKTEASRQTIGCSKGDFFLRKESAAGRKTIPTSSEQERQLVVHARDDEKSSLV